MAKIGPYRFRVPKSFDELYTDLRTFIGQITRELVNLTPAENFDGFESEVTFNVGAAVDVKIPNKFRDGRIPTRFLVVDTTAELRAHRGATQWDGNYIYLRNAAGATNAIAKIHFLP